MLKLSNIVSQIHSFVWGPVMLVLLVGTGVLLTVRCNFLTWRNLPWALKKTLSKEARTKSRGTGDVSPFSALTTALAATIGTGNIVGVATAMVSGGAGALVWMWISACFGLSSKFSECMLAIKYREVNEKGEMSGGPMYTMKKGLKNKKLGAVLGWLFALFAVIASFGIGNMTQGNSIATSIHATFGISVTTVGGMATDWANEGVFGDGWSLFGLVDVPGIPVLVENGLNAIHCADWLSSLILDGVVAGVGAVLGFVPQILILFIFLAFLEGCGYMSRVAFIMDRIFRKFGLSGKSFIPMLIGSGCGVPGVMASRTIENDRDRKMTIMTTTFVPCSAKLPIIALIAGALFDGASWVAPSAYFVGVAAIICSGIILKKTKMFAGDPAPFVMELPAYHLPTIGTILRSMWERGWSFIKKAGTIILMSTIVLWFLMSYGWVKGKFGALDAEQLNSSILASIGKVIAPIFAPLGWNQNGNGWEMAVAAVTGLIAKENVVGTFGMLFGFAEVAEDGKEIWGQLADSLPQVAAYGFLVFNLLCAPCFAAMGAIKREMNNAKWFWFAIGYQCILAYVVALCIYQIGMLITAGAFGVGTVAAFILVVGFLYLLFRPAKEVGTLETAV